MLGLGAAVVGLGRGSGRPQISEVDLDESKRVTATPVTAVDLDKSKGVADAPVVVVEYGDFQ